ncbi:4999_t:CDS:2 [Ambispora gerdemannii]|uniref:4999_t:CDS:1 n=1 Tax=Ambispora gerdemannii TaxID=144530 RepID=A0A9N9BXA7_9GLOM|nr:4999_t:CDS:2 [Ambispora gerdemannii]
MTLQNGFQISANYVVSGFIGLLGLISFDLGYNSWRNKANERYVDETLEKGSRPYLRVPKNYIVPRSEVLKDFLKIFEPGQAESTYTVICGEHGTGKTVLIKIAANKKSFATRMNEKILDPKSTNEIPNFVWTKNLKAFERAAEVQGEVWKTTGSCFDNISLLDRMHPRIVDILQDNAKEYADD